MRRCPFSGCHEQIPGPRDRSPQLYHSCSQHWFRLSDYQRKVWRSAEADFRDGTINDAELERIRQELTDQVQGSES